MKYKILWLRERFSWMGQHSGYDQVCEAVAKLYPGSYQSVWRRVGQRLPLGAPYFLSNLSAGAKHSPFYDLSSAYAEAKVLGKACYKKPDLIHVTYVENNLGFLLNWKDRLSFKLVGTVHQPGSWWRLLHPHPHSVSYLDGMIVCSSREVAYFEQFLPGRVFFIPHGVDLDYFHPPGENLASSDRRHFVFSGCWLRDIETLERVVGKVLRNSSQIAFDAIIPRNNRNNSLFHRLARHDRVRWYDKISNGHLRKIYQKACGLVLPLIDCTANNSLLEAMACGLPIISNNIGGIPDYTRDTFAELLPVGDVDGMVNAILKLAEDAEGQRERGKAARLFTEENFSWNTIAERTVEVYQKVMIY